MGRYVTYHDMMASPPPFSFALDCTASARRTYLGATSTTLAHMPCTLWPLPLLHSRQSIEAFAAGPAPGRRHTRGQPEDVSAHARALWPGRTSAC